MVRGVHGLKIEAIMQNPSVKYYLLCDFLDMKPMSTATTDIEEVLVMRRAKRMSSTIRKSYSSFSERQLGRKYYIKFLKKHPYSSKVFKRFIRNIFTQLDNEKLEEDDVLEADTFNHN